MISYATHTISSTSQNNQYSLIFPLVYFPDNQVNSLLYLVTSYNIMMVIAVVHKLQWPTSHTFSNHDKTIFPAPHWLGYHIWTDKTPADWTLLIPSHCPGMESGEIDIHCLHFTGYIQTLESRGEGEIVGQDKLLSTGVAYFTGRRTLALGFLRFSMVWFCQQRE